MCRAREAHFALSSSRLAELVVSVRLRLSGAGRTRRIKTSRMNVHLDAVPMIGNDLKRGVCDSDLEQAPRSRRAGSDTATTLNVWNLRVRSYEVISVLAH